MTDDRDRKIPQMLLSPGMIFDKYRIIRFVGHGGMAEVYQAEHLLLKQIFALKVIKNFGDQKQAHVKKRFLREAKCFHLLEHPNIVRVYDIGCDASTGCLYIAMEFLEGGNLLLPEGKRLSEQELLDILRDMSFALIALEKHQMVHRDIKPSNIMRTADGHYKLMDLGIAKTAWEEFDSCTLTQDDMVIGTPAYASPEQCRSPHKVDIRADIYSLGVTLYHLASGVKPYSGATPVETILNVLSKEPPSLETVSAELSLPFRELVEAMMAKNPDDRPQDAESLYAMAEAVRQGKRVYRFRSGRKKITFLLWSVVTALLVLAAAGIFLFPSEEGNVPENILPEVTLLPEKEPETTASLPVSTEKKEKKLQEKTVPAKEFVLADFIDTSRPRGVKTRLEETGKILDYLHSSGAKGTPFLNERIKFFSDRRKTLENLQRQKNRRKERAIRVSCSPELRQEIENCLKNCTIPFRFDAQKYHTAMKIIRALADKEIDPDSLFTDGTNEKRSLTGIALAGFLPKSEEMLKQLIFSGADIDANLGSPVKFPNRFAESKLKMRLTGIKVFNGAENIDTDDNGRALLLSVMNPAHSYLVCRPEQNSVDWNLAGFLVDTGTLIDAEDLQGRTPLHFAALHNRGDLITKLLLAGAVSGKKRDNDGNTPYHYAIKNHAFRAVQALERFGMGIPVSLSDRAQGSLLIGILRNIPLQVEQSLDNGASTEYIYSNGLNALQNAVLMKNLNLVKFLLERGALLEGNAARISILGIAVCVNSPEVFGFLLDKIKPENMVSRHGSEKVYLPESILSHYRRSPEIAKAFLEILLKNKWDINYTPVRGRSALLCALSMQDVHIDVIRFLLQKGADPRGPDGHVHTHRSNPEINKVLAEAAQKKASRP